MATRVVEKAFSIITPEDHNALHGIYRHRCLNDRQLAEYFYKDLDDGKNDYTLMRINELVENWLIDAHEYKPGSINPEDERDNLLNKDLQSYDPLYEPEDLDESIHRNILYERAERIMKRHLNNTQQFVVRQMMNKVPQSKTAKVLKTSQSEVSKILKTSICIIRLKMQEEEESGWLSDDEVCV